jgi:lipopolysaccharide biosynthesis protein
MVVKKKIAVLYHIFYEDTIDNIREQVRSLTTFEPAFLFNISADTPDQLEIRDALLQNFPGSIITISSNQGKDIGAKLLLLSTCIDAGLSPDWIIFLHDKKSLQALNAKTWKSDLLRIIDSRQIEKISDIISNASTCGIIAAENYVVQEIKQAGKFISKNGPIIDQLLEEYNIKCKSFDYVAGTMFWAKADVLLDFFKKYDPLKIRQTLEYGNVLDDFSGSNTHSWERILSWIILSQGLTIKTV